MMQHATLHTHQVTNVRVRGQASLSLSPQPTVELMGAMCLYARKWNGVCFHRVTIGVDAVVDKFQDPVCLLPA